MAKTAVSVSRAPADSTLLKGFDSDVTISDSQLALDAMERSAEAVPLQPERFAKEFYGKFYGESYKRQPDVFKAGGFWRVLKHFAFYMRQPYRKACLSRTRKAASCDSDQTQIALKNCADVLKQHDLGQTRLYLTKSFQHDRERPVEGEYFCLALGEQKQAFLPEVSPNFEKPYESEDLWRLPLGKINDNDCAVSQSALGGPALWADLLVWCAFFLSDDLVQSLRAAKLTRRWGLRRCRVIS